MRETLKANGKNKFIKKNKDPTNDNSKLKTEMSLR